MSEAAAAGPVRMTRAGNSRMLPVPAGVARLVHAEPGSRFLLEVIGSDLVYHRLDDAEAWVRTTGSGRTRVFTPSGVGFAEHRAGVGLLDGWDW